MKTKHTRKRRMIPSGPFPEKIRNSFDDDIFLSRLKLLIIMAKSYLKGYPLGKYRKQAIAENAKAVFYRSLQHANVSAYRKDNELYDQSDFALASNFSIEPIFYKEIQLFAVTINAIVENRPTNRVRNNDIKDHLDKFSTTPLFNNKFNDMGFLKVA